LLRSIINDGCISSVILKGRIEEDRSPTIPREKTMLWNQTLGHIGEKILQALHGKGMVEVMSDCSSNFNLFAHYVKQNHVSFPYGCKIAK
jgi:hypothetical protein